MELFFRQTRKDLGIGCPEASELATGSVGQSTRGDPAVSQARLGVGYDYVMGDHKPGQQVVVCRASRSRLARLRAGGMMHDPMAQWPVRTRTRKALGWLLTEEGGKLSCLSLRLSVCLSVPLSSMGPRGFSILLRCADGRTGRHNSQPASQPANPPPRKDKARRPVCPGVCCHPSHPVMALADLQTYLPRYIPTARC